MKYVYLSIAIIAEVIATNALNASNGFTKAMPSVLVVIGYCSSFYCLSHALRFLPVGMVYAIWAGFGIVLSTFVAAILFKQIPDIPSILGMALIVLGVIIMNLYSKNALH